MARSYLWWRQHNSVSGTLPVPLPANNTTLIGKINPGLANGATVVKTITSIRAALSLQAGNTIYSGDWWAFVGWMVGVSFATANATPPDGLSTSDANTTLLTDVLTLVNSPGTDPTKLTTAMWQTQQPLISESQRKNPVHSNPSVINTNFQPIDQVGITSLFGPYPAGTWSLDCYTRVLYLLP